MTILALDIVGVPKQWVSCDDAIKYHALGSVAWSIGETVARYRGGIQRNGKISYIETTSIIAIRGHGFDISKHGKVALTNQRLFGRDRHICGYCGGYFENYKDLSRDHVVPISRGGTNNWLNVITACKGCNGYKANKLLKECDLELRFIPYIPNHHESLLLSGRNVLIDQMDYLKMGIPKHSRVFLN